MYDFLASLFRGDPRLPENHPSHVHFGRCRHMQQNYLKKTGLSAHCFYCQQDGKRLQVLQVRQARNLQWSLLRNLLSDTAAGTRI